MTKKRAPDQDQRDLAVSELNANMLIDAGAGTGKTSTIVARLIAMVAPPDDRPARRLDRIAAVTFTRRAAGELRLRVRQGLLKELSATDLSTTRHGRLIDALGMLDTASVGTIHSFSDRLLRLRPIEAQLSPAYAIMEDPEALLQEAFGILLHTAQSGTLSAELAGTAHAARAAEVEETIAVALDVGLLPKSIETNDFFTKIGLDLLARRFVDKRDLPPIDPPLPTFDAMRFRQHARDFIARTKSLGTEEKGDKWLRATAKELSALLDEKAPTRPLKLGARIEKRLKPKYGFKKKDDFAKGDGWGVWKAFRDGEDDGEPLSKKILDPARRWLAHRLVRTMPVVVALYEKVKARRQAVDSIDLLLKLRDLLRDNRDARAFYQGLFDHVFIDEFQDTDPLQAEILLYLCEKDPVAARWQDVVLARGRLTIVGDPKQSIYRFRRADVAMYDQIRKQIAAQPHVAIRLDANFRSTAPLVRWQNARFAEILGRSPEGAQFDADTGEVFHQPLLVGRAAANAPAVHAVPYQHEGDDGNADACRLLEAEAMAHYLRWLVEKSGQIIEDPTTGETRSVRYSDVAVLALVTPHLPKLFTELDRMGVPYAASGGTMFVADPLHRLFLLGLRAIADRDDGVAQAALFRPPFFAVDLLDLIHERELKGAPPETETATRAREAVEWVTELRKNRFSRSPGATARKLLDESAFARTVALGPNGLQRLHHLRELCLALEHTAATEGLDFDAVTARMRDWVTDPVQLDAPRPVGTDAIQVMTVHQAKGLEFPVVIIWDGVGLWKAFEELPVWGVDRNGAGWALDVLGLSWEEPAGLGWLEKAKRFANAEKKRLVYVAATRARDLLVVPKPRRTGDYFAASLLADADPKCVVELAPYREGIGATWSKGIATREMRDARVRADVEENALSRWRGGEAASVKPLFKPVAVSVMAHAEHEEAEPNEDGARTPRKARPGRHGPLFGETVHRAIGLVLKHGIASSEAVKRAATATRLEGLSSEAAADVERAIAALEKESMGKSAGAKTEYPVAAAGNGMLVAGYIDLIAVKGDTASIVDFKTDAAPRDAVGTVYPEYVAQVKAYGRMIGMEKTRCGLLFTETGELLWVQ